MTTQLQRREKALMGLLLCGLAFALTRTASAHEPPGVARPAHGYPGFRDLNGKTLGDGEFLQWLEDGKLHIKISYRFKDGRRIEETGLLRQKPEIVQDAWSWRETKGGETLRAFAIDFGAQTATAEKRENGENGELKHW